MRNIKKTIVILFLAGTFVAPKTQAADCSTATNPYDKTICATPDLQTLNTQLIKSQMELQNEKDPALKTFLLETQKFSESMDRNDCEGQWRNNPKSLARCIRRRLNERIDETKTQMSFAKNSPVLEVRERVPGTTFSWLGSSSKSQLGEPVFTEGDFTDSQISTGEKMVGSAFAGMAADIALVFTPEAAKKYNEMGKINRSREFCLVFRGFIMSCGSFDKSVAVLEQKTFPFMPTCPLKASQSVKEMLSPLFGKK